MPPYTFQFGEVIEFACVRTLSSLAMADRRGNYFLVMANFFCGGCGERHTGSPFYMSCN